VARDQRERAGLAAEATEDLGETGRTRSRTRNRGRGNSRRGAEGTEAGPARPKRRRRRTRGGREIEGDRQLSWEIVSTPTALPFPDGVRKTRVETVRGVFAALEATPPSGVSELGTAVLVPGYTGSKEDFLSVLGRLAAAGRRVISIDMRGQYETPGTDDPAAYLPAELGADIEAVLAATGAIHLVGHSFGGLVTRETVLACAPRPRTFTLMSSGPSALTGERAAELRLMMSYLGEEVTSERISEIWYGHLEPQARANGTPEPIVAFLRDRMLSNSPAALAAMARHLLSAPDKTEYLAKFADLPLLVLYGEDDNAWSPEIQEEMAARLGALRVCIPGAAHSPAVEAPVTTADALTSFWNTAEP
jgi:pimeloyl-ACP methyl ester carboxylesterase